MLNNVTFKKQPPLIWSVEQHYCINVTRKWKSCPESRPVFMRKLFWLSSSVRDVFTLSLWGIRAVTYRHAEAFNLHLWWICLMRMTTFVSFVLLYTLLLLFLHPVFMTYLHQKLGGNKNREKNQFVVRIVKKRVGWLQPHFLPAYYMGQMMESSKPTNNILCWKQKN